MEIPNFSPEEQEEIINTFLSNLVGCKKVKKIKKIKERMNRLWNMLINMGQTKYIK